MKPTPEQLRQNEPQNHPQFSEGFKKTFNEEMEEHIRLEDAGLMSGTPAKDYFGALRERREPVG